MLSRSPSVSVPAGTLAAANNLSDLASVATARTNLDVYNDDEVHRLLGTRAVKDCLFSDGATSNRRGEATFGTKGAVAGMPISIPFEIDVPTSNPSADNDHGDFCPAYGSVNTNSLRITHTTTGALTITQSGASGSDYRRLSYAGFRAAYEGKRVRGMVVFESGNTTTSPKIYLIGIDCTSSFSPSTGGTPPNWMPTTLDTTKFLTGFQAPAGRFVPHAPILGALTAAEVLAWTVTGRLPEWCEIGTGSAVAAYTSDFSASVDTWVAGGSESALTANTDSIDSQDDWLKIERTTAGSGRNDIARDTAYSFTRRGHKVMVRARIHNPADSPHTHFVARFGGAIVSSGANSAPVSIPAGSSVDVEFTSIVADTASFRIEPCSSNGNVASVSTGTIWYVKNIELRTLGPLAKWEIQPVATCYDAGDNKIPLLLTSGITPITNRRDWILQGQTSTNGNQQLLGASAFVSPYDYTKHMIDWLETNGTSTATVTIGSASGGAQYKASAALVTGRNRHTLVTPIPASAAIWAASSTADALQHTIRGHLID